MYVVNRSDPDAIGQENSESTVMVGGTHRPGLDNVGRKIGGGDIDKIRAFWLWADKTKVVNDDGAPLVVYHGTIVRDSDRAPGMGDIREFDRLFTTKFRAHSIDTVGSWFSTNPGAGGAEMYSGSGSGAVIYPVFLAIENPQETTFHLLQRRARLLANGVDDGRPLGKNEVDAYRKWLKDMGKDGIKIVHDEYSDNGSTEFKAQTAWIALEPQQVKSATGNPGSYCRDTACIADNQTVSFGAKIELGAQKDSDERPNKSRNRKFSP